MAYCISSLLESPYQLESMTTKEDKNKMIESNNKMNHDKALSNLNECLNNNFWIAYDALDSKNSTTLLQTGIQMAKDL